MNNEAVYLRYSGPVQLAYEENELEGQGPEYHKHGFGTPVGPLKGSVTSPARLTEADLKKFVFTGNEKGTLEFVSCVKAPGRLQGLTKKGDVTLIATFTDCRVTFGDRVLFEPTWGTFDMACGLKVASAFGDAPDRA